MGDVMIDMTGKRCGRLVALRPAGRASWGPMNWLCQCDCGNTTVVCGKYLRSGNTRSCGCLRDERIAMVRRTHAKSGTRTHRIYGAMLTRCYNPNQRGFKYYGALGVSVCQRWRDGFSNFLIDMGEVPEGMSLDRIDPLGNYCPENCRWSTPEVQALNKRDKALINLLMKQNKLQREIIGLLLSCVR